MHIPDNVLDPRVAAATGAVAAAGLLYGLRRLEGQLRDRATVLMGTMSAFVFAAQMVNFPLYPLPISGHLLGGVLSAVLLGPWAGAVVIGVVLIGQCFLFGDGGVTALGGRSSPTTSLGGESAEVESSALLAVARSLRRDPTSAGST